MYDWGNALERGKGRDPFVFRGFHRVGHGSGVCFFVTGGCIRVESTVSMVQRSGDKTHKSFAKCQEKSRVMAT